MDSRMEAALREDASMMASASSEVPASLRSLIAKTPAAVTTASVGAATTATVAKMAATKIALWSAGALLVASAGYYAMTSNDKTPINPRPEEKLIPIATTVDSSKPKADSMRVVQTKPLKNAAAAPSQKYTQAQVDSMLLHLQTPPGTMRISDSVQVSGSKRRKP